MLAANKETDVIIRYDKNNAHQSNSGHQGLRRWAVLGTKALPCMWQESRQLHYSQVKDAICSTLEKKKKKIQIQCLEFNHNRKRWEPLFLTQMKDNTDISKFTPHMEYRHYFFFFTLIYKFKQVPRSPLLKLFISQ